MKKLLVSLSLLAMIAICFVAGIFSAPYYFYHEILENNYRSEWFNLGSDPSKFLAPCRECFNGLSKQDSEALEREEKHEDEWMPVHLNDVVISVPVRNPIYQAIPRFSSDRLTKRPRAGLELKDSAGRTLNTINFLDNRIVSSELRSQKIFKLPLVADFLKSFSQDQIWEKIFTQEIGEWNIDFSQMLLNLYLLQMRSNLFAQETQAFALYKDSTGILRLNSQDKDFMSELVMTRRRGVVYAFHLMSRIDDRFAMLMRERFLRDMTFRPSSSSLAGMFYREFRSLAYPKKISHEGLFTLLSAWSHDPRESRYVQEMISFMERGKDNEEILQVLYAFAQKEYGKTYAQRRVEGLILDPELQLKVLMDLEAKKNEHELLKEAGQVDVPAKIPSEQESFEGRLRKAKESIHPKKRLRVD